MIGKSLSFHPLWNRGGFGGTCLTCQRVKFRRKGCFCRPPGQGFQLLASSSQIPIVDFLRATRTGAYFRKPYFGFLAYFSRISGDLRVRWRACSGLGDLLLATGERLASGCDRTVALGCELPLAGCGRSLPMVNGSYIPPSCYQPGLCNFQFKV